MKKVIFTENSNIRKYMRHQFSEIVQLSGQGCGSVYRENMPDEIQSYFGFCLGAHQTEVNKVEVKSIGFSGARETETGVCACCGISNLKEIESKTRKLLKESIQKFIRKNTNLSLHWPRLYRAGRKLLQVISELHGDSKGHKSLRDIRVLNNLRKKNVLHIRPNLLTYFMRWASLALYTLYLPQENLKTNIFVIINWMQQYINFL